MRKRKASDAAAVLIFAVLLLAAGVFVLAGIAQLAATQSLAGRREWDALSQRVTLENSRAMARQFVLARMFSNVVSTTTNGFTNTVWGGFSITAESGPASGLYWEAPSVPGANSGLKINPFNSMERGGFYPGVAKAELLEVSASGTNTVGWKFLVRMRSPIAAGYSYVRQYPATQPDLGAAVHCVYVEGSGTDRYLRFVGGTDSKDIPDVPFSSTTNTNSNDPDGYGGSFAVPIKPVVSQFTGGVSVAGVDDPNNPTKLRVEIDLQTNGFALPSSDEGLALHYPIPAQADFTNTSVSPPVTVTANVTELMIKGSTDGFRQPPLLIVVTNHPHLTNIVLSGRNVAPNDGRRVYLQLDSLGQPQIAVTVTNNDAATWRLGLSVRNCDSVDFGGLAGVELVGGLRTDVDTLGLGVASESDPQGLDYIADQMMWLEDYRAR